VKDFSIRMRCVTAKLSRLPSGDGPGLPVFLSQHVPVQFDVTGLHTANERSEHNYLDLGRHLISSKKIAWLGSFPILMSATLVAEWAKPTRFIFHGLSARAATDQTDGAKQTDDFPPSHARLDDDASGISIAPLY